MPFKKEGLVLVAEGSDLNRKLLNDFLLQLGFEVACYSNGFCVWEALQKHKNLNPCLILCDVMMLGMSSLELLRRIRHSQKYVHIPVLLTLPAMDNNYVLKASSLGVSAYLLKPITQGRLLQKLDEVFCPRKAA